MTIQVLVATMDQEDFGLLDRLNIQTDAVVVNQCQTNSYEEFTYKGNTIRWINDSNRGVSKSRNLALANATADICMLCDDDEHFVDGYANVLHQAYYDVPDADLIVFNVNRIGWNEKEKAFSRIKRIPRHKTYSTVHLSFRRESIISNDIEFNEVFGPGSGMYSCAEDSLFCMSCHSKGLKMYVYPKVIADVQCISSTWFSGYNERYFYDVGAYLAAAFPHKKHLYKWYYPFRFKYLKSIPNTEMIRYINAGIDGYHKQKNYDEFFGIE